MKKNLSASLMNVNGREASEQRVKHSVIHIYKNRDNRYIQTVSSAANRLSSPISVTTATTTITTITTKKDPTVSRAFRSLRNSVFL